MLKGRKNISDYIYDTIKEEFISGELEFGDKIVETEYCKKLNVSRTPLREAIKKLEIEGIVERSLNGRIKIMDMDENRIREMAKIRMALEDIILENVGRSKNLKEAIKELKENLKLTKFQISSENWREARKLFVEYNDILYKYSELEFTIKILNSYTFILSKLRKKALTENERVKEAYEEHVTMVKFLEEGKIKQAKDLNRKHLFSSKTAIIKYFNNKK
ncbi:MAG: GntR family transcriptional regulator [Fusobacterium sp. JB021]|nr:GntR family transcriptional regulator [Fusobacterium sp. JB021]MDP0507103.1 GntR family transcriptional regulator [Fusobacterium sp. JB019]